MVGAGRGARVTPSSGQGARRPPSTPGRGAAARRRAPGPRAEAGPPGCPSRAHLHIRAPAPPLLRPPAGAGGGAGRGAGRGAARGRRARGRGAQAFVAQPPFSPLRPRPADSHPAPQPAELPNWRAPPPARTGSRPPPPHPAGPPTSPGPPPPPPAPGGRCPAPSSALADSAEAARSRARPGPLGARATRVRLSSSKRPARVRDRSLGGWGRLSPAPSPGIAASRAQAPRAASPLAAGRRPWSADLEPGRPGCRLPGGPERAWARGSAPMNAAPKQVQGTVELQRWEDTDAASSSASGRVARQPLERLLISYCSPPSAVIRRDPPSARLSRLCGSSASFLWLLSGSSPVLCVPAFRQCVQRENSFHFPVLEFVSSPDSRSRIYFHLGILCNDYLLKSRCPRPALWLSRCSSRL
ncbi:WAS/WASL-interacting protein family member 1 [Oryctolagus cuniculus]|uniref:WAS/WASL-interacting protein family member 1 n=1 Tax=Oryctolagus cuniculus TaxID=9986 RepID=UPI003879CB9D